VILLARFRVGEELQRAPDARGGDRKSDQNRSPKGFDRPSLEEQVGSQTRSLNLKKLFELGKERMLNVAGTLWRAGRALFSRGYCALNT
jgi:hypothetical protein